MFPARKENRVAEEDQEQLAFLVNLDLMDPVGPLAELDLLDPLESLVPVVIEVKWVLHSKENQEKRVKLVHLEQQEVEQERLALTLEKKIFTLDQKATVDTGDKKAKLVTRVLLVLLD